MYDYNNNKDKSKEEGLHEWYDIFSNSNHTTRKRIPFNFTLKLISLYREIMERYPSVREGKTIRE